MIPSSVDLLSCPTPKVFPRESQKFFEISTSRLPISLFAPSPTYVTGGFSTLSERERFGYSELQRENFCDNSWGKINSRRDRLRERAVTPLRYQDLAATGCRINSDNFTFGSNSSLFSKDELT